MRYKYFMKLYIDKKCKICENFGKIINEKNSMIEIKDYREKDSESILFEDGSKIYYEFNAIHRALSCAGKKNIILTSKFINELSTFFSIFKNRIDMKGF